MSGMNDAFFLNQFDIDELHCYPSFFNYLKKATPSHDDFIKLLSCSDLVNILNLAIDGLSDNTSKLNLGGQSDDYFDWRLYRNKKLSLVLHGFSKGKIKREYIAIYPNNMRIGVYLGSFSYTIYTVDNDKNCLIETTSGIATQGQVFSTLAGETMLVIHEIFEPCITLNESSVEHLPLIQNFKFDTLTLSHISSADVAYSRLESAFKIFEMLDYKNVIDKLTDISKSHPMHYIRWSAATVTLRLSEDTIHCKELLNHLINNDESNEVSNAARQTLNNIEVMYG
ncbi:hypothetical protein A9267_21075 [Shewanella sp. UCD-FRSSP16_17]|uniref:hypothetical protein n=1 Tax=Shewanella sp. UCD-FRSSP16_17 TaxID=1853256 RepID=UPI0007EED32C|nr:hypothetical protein [Shewanella sp. UCD-FRSSP16_17]OBT09348.1 hypothetical protein A9267_21075 [Shewanella sp. UCD-FRSSP16_17]